MKRTVSLILAALLLLLPALSLPGCAKEEAPQSGPSAPGNTDSAPGGEDSPADYAALVARKCGFEDATVAYLNAYRYAPDLWRKLWLAMEG